MSAAVRWTVQRIVLGSQEPKVRYEVETEAVDAAYRMVGPNVTQVCIEADPQPYEAGTFSIRHITLKGGQVRDSGWRSWLHGEFVEAVHPADLGGES